MTILTNINNELTAVVANVQKALVQLSHKRRGVGSGVIWQEDGLIVTNAHVVQGRSPRATLWDGRHFDTTLLATDDEHDLAALSIDATNLPAIQLGDSVRLKPGQWVTAVGHPWGIRGAASFGNVIEMGTPLEWNGSRREMVQVGIQLRPGHSGGPMVDEDGRLIGINTLITGPQVGLAVPVHIVTKFIEKALGNQVIRHM